MATDEHGDDRYTQLESMNVAEITPFVGALLALLLLFERARAWFRRTIGRRQDRYRALRRLGTGARLEFFESVLGEPPAITARHILQSEVRDDDGRTTSTSTTAVLAHYFIQADHYVQAITDTDETVLAFSVTTRSAWFRPTFTAPAPMGVSARVRTWLRFHYWPKPLLKIKLNRTRFAQADPPQGDDTTPDDLATVGIYAWMGARSWGYSEQHYFGNPGHYQTFVLSANSNVPFDSADTDSLHEIASGLHGGFDDGTASTTGAARRFRKRSVVTTYSVLSHQLDAHVYARHLFFGPHGDEVRTLP